MSDVCEMIVAYTPAMMCTVAKLHQNAITAAIQMPKARAREYARQPWQLEMVLSGLSEQRPQFIYACATILKCHELRNPRKDFGFGSEVPLVNLRAAQIYARYLRYVQYHCGRKSTA